jgi:hypothetical protein
MQVYLYALPFISISLQRYCRVSTFQHNVRVLPCAFFCFGRLPALLLSSIVHALIDSLRLATLPLTEVFLPFPVALSASNLSHSLSSPKKILPLLTVPPPRLRSCLRNPVTVEISELHYLHVSDTRCILSLLNSQCPILAPLGYDNRL